MTPQQAENVQQKTQHPAFTLFSCSYSTAKFNVERTELKQSQHEFGISLPAAQFPPRESASPRVPPCRHGRARHRDTILDRVRGGRRDSLCSKPQAGGIYPCSTHPTADGTQTPSHDQTHQRGDDSRDRDDSQRGLVPVMHLKPEKRGAGGWSCSFLFGLVTGHPQEHTAPRQTLRLSRAENLQQIRSRGAFMKAPALPAWGRSHRVVWG